MNQHTAALSKKKITGGTTVWIPIPDRNCPAKIEKPVRPATPMKRYAQIRLHPDITPDVGPSPRPV